MKVYREVKVNTHVEATILKPLMVEHPYKTVFSVETSFHA